MSNSEDKAIIATIFAVALLFFCVALFVGFVKQSPMVAVPAFICGVLGGAGVLMFGDL